MRRHALVLAFYAVTWALVTFPACTHLSSKLLCDDEDGLQGVWNLWWVDEAVTELHASPWHTTYLHHPDGVSLVSHTLSPLNGFAAIPLNRTFGLVGAWNAIFVLSFVLGGWTAFLLAFDVTRSRRASLVAGFVFTFSSYHFAHAGAHLQLLGAWVIPLFVLAWRRLLERRSVAWAAGSAGALLLVILCDYYYFAFSLLAAVVLALAESRRGLVRPVAWFALFSLATSGPLVGALLLGSRRDPLLYAHRPELFSLDLLGLVVPGPYWRFAALTKGYWEGLPGNEHESSSHLGLAVLAVGAIAGRERPRGFLALAVVAALLALGPVLHVAGHALEVPLPYAWLARLVPALALGGCPARLVVLVSLAASVLAAAGLARLWREGRRPLAGFLVALAVVEALPRPLAETPIEVPAYVRALAVLPGEGAVVDNISSASRALWHQTRHRRPLAFGYVARLPQSVRAKDLELEALLRAGEASALRGRGFKYLVLTPDQAAPWVRLRGATVVFADERTAIVDLGPL